MRRLTEIQDDLQGVTAAIAHAERTVAQHPNVPSVAATLRTIQKRRESLEEQFAAAANELGLDLCSYRIEYENRNQATISAVTAALNSFQKIFTSVYDAHLHGPKKTSKVSAESIDATAFAFAYTFPGSVGFMMTLANEKLLVDKTPLDAAIGLTLELLSVKDREKIETLTEVVGLPAVRQTLQWAKDNAKARLGADIRWHGSNAIIESRIQPEQIASLAGALALAVAKEEVVLTGELIHVNMSEKTFEMKVDRRIINGTFDKAISASHPAKLPKAYKATMTVTTKIAIEENESDTTYFLMSLDEPDPDGLFVSLLAS